ncbi:MAG: hypothetical protein WC320_00965 [Candidatus Paceibacterota bacterium]|jgi:hypothetical protein
MTITLDTNCLIDLEEKRNGYVSIEKITNASKRKKLDVAIVAISAIDKKIHSNFSEFQQWLENLGLSHLTILKPLAYTNISFVNWCVVGGGILTELDHKIHDILFQNLPYSLPSDDLMSKWVNAKADVLIMWAHIWNRREIFITRDKNFLKDTKKQKLEKLGAGTILTPEEFYKN